jgi:hypothetical protein
MKRRDFLLLPGVMAMAWNQASAKVETPRSCNEYRLINYQL